MLEPYNNKKLLNLNNICDKIFNNFVNNKLHHSLLFCGNRGIGKATLCYHLANKILDFETNLKETAANMLFGDIIPNNELDENNPTFNLIKNKKHPDLLIIEKEYDQKTSETDKEIKIASARKISDFINLAPFASKNKVIIIDSIDEMNTFAQNAILKVLEEPLKNTYIFLVCHNLQNVLDTIISRCEIEKVKNYNFDEWKEIFKYVYNKQYTMYNEEQLKILYDISNGSISFAGDVMTNDGLFLYERIQNILSEQILNIEEIQNLAEQLNNNQNLFVLFTNFMFLFLYKSLKYFTTSNFDNDFKNKNFSFISRNSENSILGKILFLEEITRDIEIYNLSKKHSVIVLFNKLVEF